MRGESGRGRPRSQLVNADFGHQAAEVFLVVAEVMEVGGVKEIGAGGDVEGVEDYVAGVAAAEGQGHRFGVEIFAAAGAQQAGVLADDLERQPRRRQGKGAAGTGAGQAQQDALAVLGLNERSLRLRGASEAFIERRERAGSHGIGVAAPVEEGIAVAHRRQRGGLAGQFGVVEVGIERAELERESEVVTGRAVTVVVGELGVKAPGAGGIFEAVAVLFGHDVKQAAQPHLDLFGGGGVAVIRISPRSERPVNIGHRGARQGERAATLGTGKKRDGLGEAIQAQRLGAVAVGTHREAQVGQVQDRLLALGQGQRRAGSLGLDDAVAHDLVVGDAAHGAVTKDVSEPAIGHFDEAVTGAEADEDVVAAARELEVDAAHRGGRRRHQHRHRHDGVGPGLVGDLDHELILAGVGGERLVGDEARGRDRRRAVITVEGDGEGHRVAGVGVVGQDAGLAGVVAGGNERRDGGVGAVIDGCGDRDPDVQNRRDGPGDDLDEEGVGAGKPARRGVSEGAGGLDGGRAVTGSADRADEEGVARGVGEAGENAIGGGDAQRLAGGRGVSEIAGRRRRGGLGQDAQRDHGGGTGTEAIAEPVGKGVGAGEARARAVGERTVGIKEEAAAARGGVQESAERAARRGDVVGQHPRRGERQRGADAQREGIGAGKGRGNWGGGGGVVFQGAGFVGAVGAGAIREIEGELGEEIARGEAEAERGGEGAQVKIGEGEGRGRVDERERAETHLQGALAAVAEGRRGDGKGGGGADGGGLAGGKVEVRGGEGGVAGAGGEQAALGIELGAREPENGQISVG